MDLISDERRATGVISGARALSKGEKVERDQLELHALATEVVGLLVPGSVRASVHTRGSGREVVVAAARFQLR